MHIPDGVLDGKTVVATSVLAATGLGLALKQAKNHLPARRVPLLGLTAAFIFAAQMVNFPVAAGTSGHLVGAVLAGVLLGPSAAVIIISSVLLVQCLLFADGGFTALGANILNMGILGGVGGWAVYYMVCRVVQGMFGCFLGAVFAGWCSTVLASIACAGELAVSQTAKWSLVLPMMTGIHMLIGVGEGVITALVIAGIVRARPELLQPETIATPKRSYGPILIYGALIALGLALFASPFASTWPDGLDKTAEALGFKSKATAPVIPGPMPDYEVPGIHWTTLATSIAGGIGTVLVFILAWFVARMLASKTPIRSAQKPDSKTP